MTRVILIRERHPPNTKFDWKYCPVEYQPHYFEQTENLSSYKSLRAFSFQRRANGPRRTQYKGKNWEVCSRCVPFLSRYYDRWSLLEIKANKFWFDFYRCRDRLVVRTLRCGRSNPGSNPGHGTFFPSFVFLFYLIFFLLFVRQWNICFTMNYVKYKNKNDTT